jgi:Zn-dependent protease with chaperone function
MDGKTALSQERLDVLVNQLEGYARKNPDGYRFRVALLIVLGYAYIVVTLGGMALLLLELMAVPYAVLVLIGLVSLFWVKYKPPKGVKLDRAQFPMLFEELDRLCETLNVPKPDHIILTADLNAAVLEAPKFGLFGWYTNYLLLGLPLMQSVSVGQFRATLAHELGHLSGKHSRFSGWVYRVRRAWFMLARQQGDRASILLYPFFKWYEPFFRAYSFVLSRSDEYFADRCSAEYAGIQNAVEDLILIYVKGAQAARIWSDIYEQASHQEKPPEKVISTLLEKLRQEPPSEEAQTWLEMALARKTDHEDTHPSLSERLNAYGYHYANGKRPRVPTLVEQTAADYFLGNEVDWAATQLDAQWKEENGKLWRMQYNRAQLRSQLLKHLESRLESQPLTIEESLKLALLTAEFEGQAAAIPLLQTVVKRSPKHAVANYRLGQFLLEANQPKGLDYLKTAIHQNRSLLVTGFESLYSELNRQQRDDEAKIYLQEFQELYPTWQRAQKEREEVTEKDSFLPHNLPEAEVEQITWQLSHFPEVRDAYLVQRAVKYLPESKCYVLGIVSQFNRQNPMHSLSSWELAEIISQTLCFSNDVRVMVLNDTKKELYYALRKIIGARVV